MVSFSTGGGAGPSSDAGGLASLGPVPVDLRHVVVPLDGSPFAERALPVAAWLSAAVGARVHLVEVIPSSDEEGAENATRYLDSTCRHHHGASWEVMRDDHVGDALAAEAARSGGRLACLATHGRGRSATVGSVAVSLIERSRDPLLLVGPAARAVTGSDAPVTVALDRTRHDDTLVRVALGWAARLARRLEIVTIAEEGVADMTEPDRYVDSVRARTWGRGVVVVTRVVRDAIDVRDGLIPVLDRTSALVVLGSHVRPGPGPLAPGSHAASIVRHAAVPALVVPLPPAG
jgi:nucleotide-binding universal stress UspA family protein